MQESCCVGSARRSYLHLNANTGKRTSAGWCHRAGDARTGSLQNTPRDASDHDPPHTPEEEGRKAQLCARGLRGMSWPCLGRFQEESGVSWCWYWAKLGPSVKLTRACSCRVKCSYVEKGLKVKVPTKASLTCSFFFRMLFSILSPWYDKNSPLRLYRSDPKPHYPKGGAPQPSGLATATLLNFTRSSKKPTLLKHEEAAMFAQGPLWESQPEGEREMYMQHENNSASIHRPSKLFPSLLF